MFWCWYLSLLKGFLLPVITYQCVLQGNCHRRTRDLITAVILSREPHLAFFLFCMQMWWCISKGMVEGLSSNLGVKKGYCTTCEITVTGTTTVSLRKRRQGEVRVYPWGRDPPWGNGRGPCMFLALWMLPAYCVPCRLLMCSPFDCEVDLLPCQLVHSVNPFILLLGCTLA